jgi:AraC-like DNA-binding protein
MPIALFQQIVHQTFSGFSDEHTDALISDCYLIPADQIAGNDTAMIDGIPTMALFMDSRGTITVSQSNRKYTVQSAWLSSQYLEKVHFQNISYPSDLIVLRFDPVLFYQKFNINPASLRKKPVWSLPDALGPAGRRLLGQVNKARVATEKIKAVTLFMETFDAVVSLNSLVTDACSLVDSCKGQTSVNRLSKKLKVNYKWLERNFSRYLGISPKEYIRLQRFKYAYLDFLAHRRDYSLLQIAIANGYYDAAHLRKEIIRFTGKG